MKTAQLTAELTVAEHQEEQIVQLAEDVSCAKDIMTTLNSMVQVGLLVSNTNIQTLSKSPKSNFDAMKFKVKI